MLEALKPTATRAVGTIQRTRGVLWSKPSASMTDTQIATLCGQHFVAFKIGGLGLVPSLAPQGTRGTEILVSTRDGQRTIALQVRTALNAVHDKVKGVEGEMIFARFPLGQ